MVKSAEEEASRSAAVSDDESQIGSFSKLVTVYKTVQLVISELWVFPLNLYLVFPFHTPLRYSNDI